MQILDAHLDLAMNAMEWNRDLMRSIAEIRGREDGLTDKPDRGRGTVSLGEMRCGGIGVCVATLIARFVKPDNPRPGWNSPEQAWAQTQGQLAWYRAMEANGQMRQITTAAQLQQHIADWDSGATQAIGFILSLEGADSIFSPAHLEAAFLQGLRALGPAHYGPGTYAHGTESEGGIGQFGRDLLREMDRLGMILDVTHLCDTSYREAMDSFGGRVWASHSNCRALVPHQRQLADDQITELAGRGAVIGIALDGWMLVPDWIKRETTPESARLTLEHVVDHIDHICQIVGNALHVGIGSDLDGGFGREQTARDLDTIADLVRIAEILEQRGYSQADREAILQGNFTRFLLEALPPGQG